MDKETFYAKLAVVMADPAVRADYEETKTFIMRHWSGWKFCPSLDGNTCSDSKFCGTLFVPEGTEIKRPHDPLRCRLCDSIATMGPRQKKAVEEKQCDKTKHGEEEFVRVQHGRSNPPTFRSFCFWVAMEDRVMPFVQPTDSEPVHTTPCYLHSQMRIVCGMDIFKDDELPEDGGFLMFLLSRGVEVVQLQSGAMKWDPSIAVYMRHPQRIATWRFIEDRHLRKLRRAEEKS